MKGVRHPIHKAEDLRLRQPTDPTPDRDPSAEPDPGLAYRKKRFAIEIEPQKYPQEPGEISIKTTTNGYQWTSIPLLRSEAQAVVEALTKELGAEPAASPLQRYSPTIWTEGNGFTEERETYADMQCDPNGDYVLATDVAALEKRCAEMAGLMQKLVDAMDPQKDPPRNLPETIEKAKRYVAALNPKP